MGYNTQILLFNDGLGQIARYPEVFAAALAETTHVSTRRDRETLDLSVMGHHVGHLIPTAHADEMRVLVSHGNWMWEVQAAGRAFQDALRQEYMRDELMKRATLARARATEVLSNLRTFGEHNG